MRRKRHLKFRSGESLWLLATIDPLANMLIAERNSPDGPLDAPPRSTSSSQSSVPRLGTSTTLRSPARAAILAVVSYKGRRRLGAVVAWVAALMAGGLTALALLIGDSERIDRYWTSAMVADDGQAKVIEVIDYDFGVSDRHGIFRDIPGLDRAAPIRVSSPTAPDQFVVQPGAPSRIRIGDPDRTIDGRHRYEIEYAIGVVFDGDRLSWNAVGSDWEVGIRNVEIHVLTGRALSEVRCSKGRAGSWGGCTATQPEPGWLAVEVDSLGAREGVTVSGLLGQPLAVTAAEPAPPIGVAPDPGSGFVWPIVTAVLAALAGGAVATAAVRRAGRELVWAGGSADAAFGPQFDEQYPVRRVDHDELDSLATTEFAPPAGLTAWQGGAVYAERVTDDHKVAWLLERAIDHDVRIEGSGRDLTLHRLDGDGVARAARPLETDGRYRLEPLDRLFGGRRTVQLGSYDEQFAAAWDQLGRTLGRWHDESGLWDPAGGRRRRRVLAVGGLLLLLGVVAMVGFAVAAGRAGTIWLPGVGLGALGAGAAAAMLATSGELRIRTPEGSGLWIRTESFRRFIEGSDAQHVEAAARHGVLLAYTAWAVALGEVDHWTDSIAAAGVDAGLAPEALYLTAIAPDLGRAAHAAAVKPSSGGGGFGGGSVGGGGGGGGGGSW